MHLFCSRLCQHVNMYMRIKAPVFVSLCNTQNSRIGLTYNAFQRRSCSRLITPRRVALVQFDLTACRGGTRDVRTHDRRNRLARVALPAGQSWPGPGEKDKNVKGAIEKELLRAQVWTQAPTGFCYR